MSHGIAITSKFQLPRVADMSDSEEKSKKRKTEDESTTNSSINTTCESNSSLVSSFQLSKMRKVTVDEYKGNVLVNIREYYEDKASGELKPGAKGIALSTEQFEEFMKYIPAIKAKILSLKK